MVQVAGKDVGDIGYGLMYLTLKTPAPAYEDSFKAMRKAVELGANLWNGGMIYGPPDANSLQLLAAYFDKYPEDREKIVVSIKGAQKVGTQATPDGSPENVRRAIDECLGVLGAEKLDLFECVRLGNDTPLEQTLGTIAEYVQAGKVGGVSITEVDATTIRKAAKITKIAAVEVEFSLLCPDILENGVAEACAELDIPILAYSPLSRGFLTGGWQKPEDVPERLQRFPRFQGEAFRHNRKLADEVERIAKEKGVTVPQIALGWIRSVSGKNGLPTIIPIPGASTPERVVENLTPVDLTQSESAAINKLLSEFTPVGARWPQM